MGLPLISSLADSDAPHPHDRALRQHHAWVAENAEGIDLVRSGIPLPSDPDHLDRKLLSLRREETFRHTQTVKRQPWGLSDCADDDAMWSRLRLMCVDEHERGTGFNFNGDVHDQPDYAYSMAFRQQGRDEPNRKASSGRKHPGEDPPRLSLNLSFTALSDDPDIARFLISPHDESADGPDNAEKRLSRVSAPAPQSPTKIIYELENPVPTSPPLSFFDSSAPRPGSSSRSRSRSTGTQPPELVRDSPGYDSGDDWAVLQEPGELPSSEEPSYQHAPDTTSSGHERSAADLDVWILLE